MPNAETKLEWILRHRDEPEVKAFIDYESRKLDRETVEETLTHIWAGFYDAEDPEELLAEQIRKHDNAVRRERKIADNREHQRKLKLRKGVIVDV